VGTRQERLEASLRSTFPGLQLVSQHFESLGSPVHYRYRARVPQFAHRDDGALHVAPSALDNLVTDFARLPHRPFALDLMGTLGYTEQRRIALPPTFRVAELPRSSERKSDFGRFQLAVETADQQVRVTTTLDIWRDKIPRDQYDAFRAWLQGVDRLLKERISFEPMAK
jgi:hypothetical protein